MDNAIRINGSPVNSIEEQETPSIGCFGGLLRRMTNAFRTTSPINRENGSPTSPPPITVNAHFDPITPTDSGVQMDSSPSIHSVSPNLGQGSAANLRSSDDSVSENIVEASVVVVEDFEEDQGLTFVVKKRPLPLEEEPSATEITGTMVVNASTTTEEHSGLTLAIETAQNMPQNGGFLIGRYNTKKDFPDKPPGMSQWDFAMDLGASPTDAEDDGVSVYELPPTDEASIEPVLFERREIGRDSVTVGRVREFVFEAWVSDASLHPNALSHRSLTPLEDFEEETIGETKFLSIP